jgi:hypothetical protein
MNEWVRQVKAASAVSSVLLVFVISIYVRYDHLDKDFRILERFTLYHRVFQTETSIPQPVKLPGSTKPEPLTPARIIELSSRLSLDELRRLIPPVKPGGPHRPAVDALLASDCTVGFRWPYGWVTAQSVVPNPDQRAMIQRIVDANGLLNTRASFVNFYPQDAALPPTSAVFLNQYVEPHPSFALIPIQTSKWCVSEPSDPRHRLLTDDDLSWNAIRIARDHDIDSSDLVDIYTKLRQRWMNFQVEIPLLNVEVGLVLALSLCALIGAAQSIKQYVSLRELASAGIDGLDEPWLLADAGRTAGDHWISRAARLTVMIAAMLSELAVVAFPVVISAVALFGLARFSGNAPASLGVAGVTLLVFCFTLFCWYWIVRIRFPRSEPPTIPGDDSCSRQVKRCGFPSSPVPSRSRLAVRSAVRVSVDLRRCRSVLSKLRGRLPRSRPRPTGRYR